MTDSAEKRTPPRPDSMDLTAQTRHLRRRLIFWRRTTWLLLGTLAVVFVVLLNRGQTHQHECYQALHYFAELALKNKLGEQEASILEQQWQALPMGPAHIYSPLHYDLIVKNWRMQPKPGGESMPLAVCRDPHLSLLGEYRHILYKDEHGSRIDWVPEIRAHDVLIEAVRDNREQ